MGEGWCRIRKVTGGRERNEKTVAMACLGLESGVDVSVVGAVVGVRDDGVGVGSSAVVAIESVGVDGDIASVKEYEEV